MNIYEIVYGFIGRGKKGVGGGPPSPERVCYKQCPTAFRAV